MANLFDIVARRRRAKELTDRFREGASPDELEYFDRFYQEPTSNPIMQRGALEGELDAVDALQRQLMARGMNELQAKDAAERARAERETALGTRAKHIVATRGPGQIGGAGEGSYADYASSIGGNYEDYAGSVPQIGTGGAAEFLAEQGLPSPEQQQPLSREDWAAQQQQPLSLEDWAMQRAIEQGMAGDISAESKARYDEQTVDDRIDIIEQQATALPAELEAKGVSNEVTIKLMTEVGRLLDIAKQHPVDSEARNNAVKEAQDLFSIAKGKTGGTGFSSYDTSQFLGDNISNAVDQSRAQGATVGRESGQELIAPRQTHIEGDYPR